VKVRIEVTKRLAEMAGFVGGEVELKEGTTIAQALDVVTGEFVGAESSGLLRDGQLHPSVLVVVDGRACLPDHRALCLAGGERIDLFLPIAGG
jgi:hypothetical protein